MSTGSIRSFLSISFIQNVHVRVSGSSAASWKNRK